MEENLHCLRKGTRLIGRYIIEGVLGQGGFGITYLGIDELHEKKVAIKEFFPQGIVTRNIEYQDTVTVTFVGEKDNYEKGKERFLKEARTMAKFSKDKGIVKALDFFEINNTAYIVMEYLEGVTLKQYLRENKRIDAEDLVELLVPLIESLDEIHSQGLIHRDISPDNIMVLPDGRIKLMDFGAAERLHRIRRKKPFHRIKTGLCPTRTVSDPWRTGTVDRYLRPLRHHVQMHHRGESTRCDRACDGRSPEKNLRIRNSCFTADRRSDYKRNERCGK